MQPPLLPIVSLPQLSLGPALVVSTLACLWRPNRGALLVSAVLAYGMATDQTRMQPEFFSLPLLLWGTKTLPGALLGSCPFDNALVLRWVAQAPQC